MWISQWNTGEKRMISYLSIAKSTKPLRAPWEETWERGLRWVFSLDVLQENSWGNRGKNVYLISCSFLSIYVHLCLTKQVNSLRLHPLKAVIIDDFTSPRQGPVKGWCVEKSCLDLLKGDTSHGATELKALVLPNRAAKNKTMVLTTGGANPRESEVQVAQQILLESSTVVRALPEPCILMCCDRWKEEEEARLQISLVSATCHSRVDETLGSSVLPVHPGSGNRYHSQWRCFCQNWLVAANSVLRFIRLRISHKIFFFFYSFLKNVACPCTCF